MSKTFKDRMAALGEMKDLAAILSPLGWICLNLGFIPCIVAVLRPTLWEFFVFFVVDTLSFPIAAIGEKVGFKRVYPEFRIIFPKFPSDTLGNLTPKEQDDIFQALVHFPQGRALYTALASYVKAIPAVLVVVFYWHHQWSNATQYLLFTIMQAMGLSYFYVEVYIENHQFISNLIHDMHLKYDWSDVFKRQAHTLRFLTFDRQVRWSIAVSAFAVLIAQVSLAITGAPNGTDTAFTIITIGLCGAILVSRIQWVTRKYFMGGLSKLFNMFENFNPTEAKRSLALHSSSLLARFELVFNDLIDRLKDYEKEVSQWTFVKTEESRFRAMGEIASLVVHDLSSPIHVVHFCAHQLADGQDLTIEKKTRYLGQLKTGSERAMALVTSLRNYLKDPSGAELDTRFGDTFDHLSRILETQFLGRNFNEINVRFDPSLEPIRLKVQKANVIHIFLNIMGNAVHNLLEHEIKAGFVNVTLEKVLPGEVIIGISDNGTGLTSEAFERLTAFAHMAISPDSRTSLGLKLVRRLIENNGGSLSVQTPEGTAGTKFMVRLPTVLEEERGPGSAVEVKYG